MLSIDERNARYDLSAFVCSETVDVIATRIENLVSYGRRMSLTTYYLGERPNTKSGLSVNRSRNGWGEPVERWSGRYANQSGIQVHLEPGIESFGVNAGDFDGTEAECARAWHDFKGSGKRPYRDITHVSIEGGTSVEPGHYGIRDFIRIERLNENGVTICTLVTFDTVSSEDAAEADAALLDLLAAHVPDGGWHPAHLTKLAEKLRYNHDTLATLTTRLGIDGESVIEYLA